MQREHAARAQEAEDLRQRALNAADLQAALADAQAKLREAEFKV